MKLSSISSLSLVPSLIFIHTMMTMIQYAFSDADYNIVKVAEIETVDGELLESSVANGIHFEMNETIYNEALAEIQTKFEWFIDPYDINPYHGSEMRKYTITYNPGTVDPYVPVRPDGMPPNSVTLNLWEMGAYDYTFYARKNDEDGSDYTLFIETGPESESSTSEWE